MNLKFGILRERRYLPFFLTQALNAFDDNFFKTAMVMLVAYSGMTLGPLAADQVAIVASGVFILPFFLFSALGGQLADRFPKASLIRVLKFVQMALVAFAAFAFWTRDAGLLLFGVALFGTQSAFFGPVKYAVLPELVETDELMTATGLVEASTFIAILCGTLLGGLMIRAEAGRENVVLLLGVLTLTGFLLSLLVPRTRAAAPRLKIAGNMVAEIGRMFRHAREDKVIFRTILGISWFWLAGLVYQTLIPLYGKNILGADETVVTLLLILFSVGIGIGSLLSGRIAGGQVNDRPIPWGAAGMAIFSTDILFGSRGWEAVATYRDFNAFLDHPGAARVIVDFLGVAISGGIFIVPLYVILQRAAKAEERARIVAANNVVNALFMAVAVGVAFGLHAAGIALPAIMLGTGLLFLPIAFYLVPDLLARLSRR